jgi:hypothetical protein
LGINAKDCLHPKRGSDIYHAKAWIPKDDSSIPMLGESKMEGRIMLRV